VRIGSGAAGPWNGGAGSGSSPPPAAALRSLRTTHGSPLPQGTRPEIIMTCPPVAPPLLSAFPSPRYPTLWQNLAKPRASAATDHSYPWLTTTPPSDRAAAPENRREAASNSHDLLLSRTVGRSPVRLPVEPYVRHDRWVADGCNIVRALCDGKSQSRSQTQREWSKGVQCCDLRAWPYPLGGRRRMPWPLPASTPFGDLRVLSRAQAKQASILQLFIQI
jgi:hypothetical protein